MKMNRILFNAIDHLLVLIFALSLMIGMPILYHYLDKNLLTEIHCN